MQDLLTAIAPLAQLQPLPACEFYDRRRLMLAAALEKMIGKVLPDELTVERNRYDEVVGVDEETVEIEVDGDALLGWYASDRHPFFHGRIGQADWEAEVVKARRVRGILTLTIEVKQTY